MKRARSTTRSGPIRRRKALRRGGRLRRLSRLAPVNPKRRARLYAEQFGEHAAAVRALPCCVCGRPGPSDPHHIRSRSAGGKKRDLVPLCRWHHVIATNHGNAALERIALLEHDNPINLRQTADGIWAVSSDNPETLQ